MYERGEIDCEEDLKRLTKGESQINKNKNGRKEEKKSEEKSIKTIESIDELEIF